MATLCERLEVAKSNCSAVLARNHELNQLIRRQKALRWYYVASEIKDVQRIEEITRRIADTAAALVAVREERVRAKTICSDLQGEIDFQGLARSGLKIARIPGFPGYAVTRCGDVYALTREVVINREKHVTQTFPTRKLVRRTTEFGYRELTLYQEGAARWTSLHRVLAMTFIGPAPSESHVVRHLDGDPTNNAVSNLAWGTQKENAEDRTSHGNTLSGDQHPMRIKAKLRAARAGRTYYPSRRARKNGQPVEADNDDSFGESEISFTEWMNHQIC